MFYENYIMYCTRKGVSSSAAAIEMGFNKSSVSGWKKGSVPTDANLQRIANYFGITVAELLGEEKEKTATNGDDLSAEELDFIRLYSEADEQKKAAIRILLGM